MTRYVVVCRGPNCRHRGAAPLRKRLAELLRREPSTRLLGYSCFGQCDFGPNVAFYPDGVWYGGLAASDAERLAERARGAAVLEHFPLQPLQLRAEERQEHLASIAELIATLERDATRTRAWWWPF